jgi:sec-independent protein translocase protein TatA
MPLFAFMGLESPIHWIVIAFGLLLIFGNRLPSVMRSLGEGIVEFKKGLSDVKNETTKELDDKSSDTKKDA